MTTAASAKPTGQYALFTDDTDRYPRNILLFGLGLDSTAILLRWITEPASRTFDFDDLAVITAMTGDEYLSTSTDVEKVVLPEMRRHGLSPTSVILEFRSLTRVIHVISGALVALVGVSP